MPDHAIPVEHAVADELRIRPARREDAGRIAALILHGAAQRTLTAAEIAAEAGHPAYAEAFERMAANSDIALFVAESGGKVVGTLQVTLIPGIAARGRLRAKLDNVHVDPARRGAGIGAALVAQAITFARQRGAGLVELSSAKTRAEAHRFYVRLGFAQSHEGFRLVL